MATQRTLRRIEMLVWICLYGGLLTLVLGLAVRSEAAVLGWTLGVAGGVVAALGCVLIVVRSRLQPDDPG